MTTRIITFCSDRYLRLAAIWISYIKRLGIDNYLVIATDGSAYEKLMEQDVNTRFIDMREAGYTSVNGQYRMRIVYQYLADGYDVLLSDLDTIWKKNILAKYEDDPGFDICISQGCFPHKLSSGQLYEFNCGFIYARSNERVLRFFHRYMMELGGCDRDQPPFNRLLNNTKWPPVLEDTLVIRREKAQIYKAVDKDTDGYNPDFDLRLRLVSALTIQRGYIDSDGYIYHYRTYTLPPFGRFAAVDLLMSPPRPLLLSRRERWLKYLWRRLVRLAG